MSLEYNLRQVNLISTIIERYRNREIRIDKLINDLEAILRCLEGVEQNWINSFFTALCAIEIVYAGAAYSDRSYLSKEEILEVDENIDKLDCLVKDFLKNADV